MSLPIPSLKYIKCPCSSSIMFTAELSGEASGVVSSEGVQTREAVPRGAENKDGKLMVST